MLWLLALPLLLALLICLWAGSHLPPFYRNRHTRLSTGDLEQIRRWNRRGQQAKDSAAQAVQRTARRLAKRVPRA